MRRRLLRLLIASGALVVASAPWTPSEAQYFGQNRVQYRTFDFRVLKTPHFDIYYYPSEEAAVQIAARLAERWHTRLSTLLDYEMPDRQPLVLYASSSDFQQTNTLGGEAPSEGTGGVTEAFKRRVVLPFAGPLAETDHVLGHELVHAFQYSMTGQRSTGGFANPTATRLPLWFIEGMAEYLSLGPIDPLTAMWMRDAVKKDKLPTIHELNSGAYFPYRWGQALWAYVAGRWGDPVVGRILKTAGRHGDAENALERILGIKPAELSKEWHEALRAAYKPLVDKEPTVVAKALVGEKGRGQMNLAPALSPDGKEMLFLSEKSLFSLELYLADATSGQVERRVTDTVVDPHLDSLQFINSAGAWDMTGKRFVHAIVTQGVPALRILDVASGRVEREVPLPDVSEIYSPTWSPDGRQVAFCGQAGGFTDLFLYDLEASNLTRLTNDPYADLQPAWSPDGKAIAFVTDRFSADLESLKFGSYGLALLDPASGKIERVPTFEGAKSINPQWSADSASLYFVSDREGVSNIYRLDRPTGRLFRVTDIATGVSGITALSPTLSAAAQANHLAFTVYRDGRYAIYGLDDQTALTGTPLTTETATVDYAELPPAERSYDQVGALRRDALFGLPTTTEYQETRYKPRLALDYVSQPQIVAGTDRFGSFVAGGTSLIFSDMLGNHTVSMVFQAQGGFSDISLLTAYQNLKRRFNWGILAGQVPYVYGNFGYEMTPDGFYLENTYLYKQINRQVAALATYPFSRAKRIELNAGYRHVSFEQQLQTVVYDFTGQYVGYDETTTHPYPSLDLAEGTVAFVHDTSVFGATSPLVGNRYRLEVGGTAGSKTYATVLADYRRYVMPVRPFTLAGRLLHYGRYGKDSDYNEYSLLYLGYPGLMRGYDINSFTYADCEGNADCPIINRIAGSRLLIGNLELRFPLLGLFGGSGYYGPFPIEALAFYDVGVAWGAATKPTFFGGDQKPVHSAGAGFRVNVFGFLVAEIDYVKPFDRPAKGAFWQFSLVPGF